MNLSRAGSRPAPACCRHRTGPHGNCLRAVAQSHRPHPGGQSNHHHRSKYRGVHRVPVRGLADDGLGNVGAGERRRVCRGGGAARIQINGFNQRSVAATRWVLTINPNEVDISKLKDIEIIIKHRFSDRVAPVCP